MTKNEGKKLSPEDFGATTEQAPMEAGTLSGDIRDMILTHIRSLGLFAHPFSGIGARICGCRAMNSHETRMQLTAALEKARKAAHEAPREGEDFGRSLTATFARTADEYLAALKALRDFDAKHSMP